MYIVVIGFSIGALILAAYMNYIVVKEEERVLKQFKEAVERAHRKNLEKDNAGSSN